MDAQLPTVAASVQEIVAEVLSSLVSKVQSRDRAQKMALAVDVRSPLDGTPRMSNTSTPDQPVVDVEPPALKRIDFGTSIKTSVGRSVITETYKKLPVRTDGMDKMETLLDQGYDSDGGQAPYFNEQN